MYAVQRRAMAPGVRWRITDDGHLERSTAASDWTRIFAATPVYFRAIAVIGNHVWAGGNDGALFHSVDGGEQWTKVEIAANGEAERGTIGSIRFDSPLQGSVTTASGTVWSTSDGGKTWLRQ